MLRISLKWRLCLKSDVSFQPAFDWQEATMPRAVVGAVPQEQGQVHDSRYSNSSHIFSPTPHEFDARGKAGCHHSLKSVSVCYARSVCVEGGETPAQGAIWDAASRLSSQVYTLQCRLFHKFWIYGHPWYDFTPLLAGSFLKGTAEATRGSTPGAIPILHRSSPSQHGGRSVLLH